MQFLKRIISFIFFIQITFSPFFIGLVVGFLLYLKLDTKNGLYAGVSIALLGLIVGIVWAIRIKKNEDTATFISKISSSSAFDNLKDESE